MSIKQTPARTPSPAIQEPQLELASASVALKAEAQAVVKRKEGQPTKFTPELWEEILEFIATYGDLVEICARPDMPAVSTVRRWYRDNPALKQDIREAWEDATYLAHSINNNILRGGILSTGDFRRDEALVKANMWHMGKTNRRDFGDKVQLDVVAHQVFVMPQDIIDGEGF